VSAAERRWSVVIAAYNEATRLPPSLSVELLRLARRRYRVVEVAVNRTDRSGSKVGGLRHAPGMFLEVVVARWRLAAHSRSRRTP